jgi:ribosome-associated translation inhibitor RaiA
MEVTAMQVPLQVSLRHMEHSEAIEALIREKVATLDASPDHIMGCRVVVEFAGKHHKHLFQLAAKGPRNNNLVNFLFVEG